MTEKNWSRTNHAVLLSLPKTSAKRPPRNPLVFSTAVLAAGDLSRTYGPQMDGIEGVKEQTASQSLESKPLYYWVN